MTEQAQFPVGAAVDLDEMTRDPYPIFAKMRAAEPVSWLPALKLYYLTRYDDVFAVLRNDDAFKVGADHMLVYDTFGKHMMTVDGPDQHRFRLAMRGPFTPKMIRERMEARIGELVDELIDGFIADGEVELREAFASRLPVRVMLAVFGLPPEDEPLLRRWYDVFEQALANYTWDEAIRANAKACVSEFKAHLQAGLEGLRAAPDQSLLAALATSDAETKLSDDEVTQNALIIFFGGISTVEALVLNAFYALAMHPETFARVKTDPSLIPQTLEEVVRWQSPVQAVTRYVAKDVEVAGVTFHAGDLVNCMIGAANRDADVFADPDIFDIDRADISRHIGFATGPHVCLGNQLARAEGRIALSRLIARLPGLEVDRDHLVQPEGYEFRQPPRLHLKWKC